MHCCRTKKTAPPLHLPPRYWQYCTLGHWNVHLPLLTAAPMDSCLGIMKSYHQLPLTIWSHWYSLIFTIHCNHGKKQYRRFLFEKTLITMEKNSMKNKILIFILFALRSIIIVISNFLIANFKMNLQKNLEHRTMLLLWMQTKVTKMFRWKYWLKLRKFLT